MNTRIDYGTRYLLEKFELETCIELGKRTIRPYSLQYLALGVVLNSNREVDDEKNELILYKHLFEGDVFTKLLTNLRYNILANNSNSKSVRADHLFNHFSEKQLERRKFFQEMIETVNPWCSCHHRYLCIHILSICKDGCPEKNRLLTAHYSDCLQFY